MKDYSKMLTVSPSELNFIFERRKNIPVTMTLSNPTSHRAAFKVLTTSPKKFCVRPSSGFVEANSEFEVLVIFQAEDEMPLFKAKFKVQYTKGPLLDVREVASDLFDDSKGAGKNKFGEIKLPVVINLNSLESIKKEELFKAIRTDDADVVKKILVDEKSVHLDSVYEVTLHGEYRRSDDWTPFTFAIYSNAIRSFDIILAAGANVDMQSSAGSTPLMVAVTHNSFEFVNKLLAAGADINIQDEDGHTALMYAAFFNCIECTKSLISAGANVQLKNSKGETAEDIAMKYNRTAIIELLRDHKHQPRQPPRRPPHSQTSISSQSGPSASPHSSPGAPSPSPQNHHHHHSSQGLEILFSELSIGEDLGRGSFGVVKLAELHQIQVAVKKFSTFGHDDPMATEVLQEMQREARLLGNLRHPNVVSMMGICTTPPCIVMEYCSKGSLFTVISDAKSKSNNMHNQLTWRRRVGLAMDTALGMTFLHNGIEPVIHRDLKSPNILVDSNWTAKVADLNLSRAMKKVDETGHTATMSTAIRPNNYRWLAPELLDPDTRASPASDVYALGIIMWELLTWEIPFGRSSDPIILRRLDKGEKLDIPALNELPGPEPAGAFPGLTKYIDLMKQCWSQDPKKRPMMAEVASALRELLTDFPTTLTEDAERPHLPPTSPHKKGPKIIVYTEIQSLLMRIVDSSGVLNIKDASHYYRDIRTLLKYMRSVPDLFTKEPAIKINTEKWHQKLAAANNQYQLTDVELADMNRDFDDVLSDYREYLQDSSWAGREIGAASTGAISECVVCLERRAVIALIHNNSNQGNTAHMCCCAECAENLQSQRLPCPLCRQSVDDIVRVY